MSVIRNVNMPKDASAIARMGKAFFDFTPVLDKHVGYDKDSLLGFAEMAQESRSVAMFVAEVDGEVVGAVAGICYPHFLNNNRVVAQELFWWVDPEHRGSTIGNELHDMLVTWASMNGARAFFMIAINNERSDRIEKLYKRKGYEPLERTYVRGI